MKVDSLISGGLFGVVSAVVAILAISFSALWAYYEKVGDSPHPPDYPVLEAIASKYRRCRIGFVCLAVGVAAILILLLPAFIQIVGSISPGKEVNIPRGALFLYYLLLLCVEVMVWLFVRRIGGKVARLEARVAELKSA
ncbi:hypothetical protein [Streptomyces olivochromogenes]|uniref:hypothetical protein n=1 Tax=Streptomyces olivochromogenes TaxID=1963 RepID=UPI001F314853|nr:hypothetical protein [Streptomyces olivochromogenes]MCF3130232.1 hypothetical protein [Streptomyces olivochromogenes]